MTLATCRQDCHSSSDGVAGRVYKIKVGVGGTNPRSVDSSRQEFYKDDIYSCLSE